ncbi:hypothetical protein [Parahaliea aestuarii]|uniref:DUF3015 domain-containing protein n=1 Tax=Parahaliea aestuarii TaxID=1852021 RepID=A0A5C8ZL47_9GAMM|nr:hypothetical protein [Parahaliea aestuarii]TXS88945.1 hypothetical protein FVW59_19335 [Parahaliea aestuarii]
MNKFYIIALCCLLFSCTKSAEKITSTTVSVYLNESNCTMYEKIMAGSLAKHQIIILEAAPVFSLYQSRKADENILRFFVEKYQKQDGILSEEDKNELANLQSSHISWANMTKEAQDFTYNLVFNGCQPKS